MRDVVIIGGGLAGLTCALRLARSGCKVFMIEKYTYPRHKVCGEYVSMEVYDYLIKENMLPQGLRIPFINKLLISTVSGRTMEKEISPGGFGISRYYFENYLYELLVKNGVEIIHDEAVHVSSKPSNVVETKSGRKIASDLIIAAYGKRTKLDRELNRPFFNRHSPYVGVKFHARLKGYDERVISLHNFDGGYCGICTVEEGISNFCYLVHRDKLKAAGGIEALESQTLFKNPKLKDAFINSEPLFERRLVINEISFETKGPIEDNIAMIGDAAGMITPLCGNGMAMAIHSSKLLSDLIIQNHDLTTERLLLEYEKQWKLIFTRRLAYGRYIQHYLFGKNWASQLAVGLGNTFPALVNYLIDKTHGKPI